ncbi:uncharacterized protein LOC100821441 isoform X1 [Brachypodium distachyon]|uniref:uncharacterized protein LOC100821441 isoform X1 n=3 Tax=Brachypodium distachyon TaxID=15368 RepID=UPI000D0DC26C|nr:uncharacterized protein LOC100821441 isoform X1 [Brachypodium distachyon]XP_024313612.1 uncharacterized protein LOC100821441 isoform X1 [Brachypodium distachyon]XP_024313613.1 uncharacterized protein LOC100821441 isoform X1 [Brachypodium distachyon]XP_024313614.1 uncharacterized protein LOC100821441 isoform X1 [Brachypodium distachyon]XP_024313615.1 uncharacterized protein LOC100821441 isoform X1 [Brachypodium distachyon]XP_024313616.1 uncharacterized protein LOC100821441 isoform X1 [Brachy|eukprot:XP_024313611.1 uncharacterized protein LOC100821441 isoform X1 [Brachypodium distachyon]
MGCGCQMIVVTSLHHGTAESDRLRLSLKFIIQEHIWIGNKSQGSIFSHLLYELVSRPRVLLLFRKTRDACCMHALLASKSSVSPAFLLLFKASSPLAGPMHEQHNTQHKRLNLTYLYLGSSTAALTLSEMSSRRSRSRQSGSSRITDEQISDLVSKLQDLLPEARLRSNDRVPSSRVLQETCSYIRSLHREVDDLSERLSELLATSDMSSAQAAIIRSLLM